MGQKSEVPMLGHNANSAMEAGLTKTGVLCAACGRTTGEEDCDPVECLRIDPKIGDDPRQKPQVVITRIVACGRADCDSAEIKATSHAFRPYVGWRIPDAETVAEALERGTEDRPDPIFRKDDVVLLSIPDDQEGRGESGTYVVMSSAHFDGSGGSPRRGWFYALSIDGTSAKALPQNPFPEAWLSLPGGGA